MLKDNFGKKGSPEKGGGPVQVEMRVSRSIGDMYKRMIASGEVQNAMMVKADNYHGDAKRAIALLNNAKVAPKYMRDGDLVEMRAKMAEAEKVIRKDNKKKKADKQFNDRLNQLKADEGLSI